MIEDEDNPNSKALNLLELHRELEQIMASNSGRLRSANPLRRENQPKAPKYSDGHEEWLLERVECWRERLQRVNEAKAEVIAEIRRLRESGLGTRSEGECYEHLARLKLVEAAVEKALNKSIRDLDRFQKRSAKEAAKGPNKQGPSTDS